MPRFFTDTIHDGMATLSGEDAAHISRSLRMAVGEPLTLCDGLGTDYFCTITAISSQEVTAQVDSSRPSLSEPDVAVTLFQGLPKGDKTELIIQKAVELGVSAVVPFYAARSVSRPDAKSAANKAERWQKIADEAAKQSQRGCLPVVEAPKSFADALKLASACEKMILFHEDGGTPLRVLLADKPATLAIWIGPEGGWSPEEAAAIDAAGGFRATLGHRILRTETAPLAALAAIMFATGNLE